MRLMRILSIFFLASIVAACGNGNNDEAENQQDNLTENTQEELNNTEGPTGADDTGNTSDDPNTQDSPYGFQDFSLEADVEDTEDAIDVEYEYESDETEASYQDQTNGINLTGEEALQQLDSILSSLTFDENTPDDEVLNEVLEAFEIPEEAKSIELDIEFQNGTEKEYIQ